MVKIANKGNSKNGTRVLHHQSPTAIGVFVTVVVCWQARALVKLGDQINQQQPWGPSSSTSCFIGMGTVGRVAGHFLCKISP